MKLVLPLLLCFPALATQYYVSNTGSDMANGTSTGTAWQSIAHVNAQTFNPGDIISFQAGGTWLEQLTVPSDGASGNPITINAYGSGAAPVISGANTFSSFTNSGGLYYSAYTTAPAQVFRDGVRLNQVSAKGSLVTGSWWLDTADSEFWVYDNPTGHTILASQRQYAIYGPCNTTYITITGLTLEYGNYRGIYFCGGTGVQASNVTLYANFEDGIRFDGGSGMTVTQSTAYYNGFYGFYGNSAGNLLFDHLSAYQNAQYVTSGFSAGIGFFGVSGTGTQTVQYCTSYNNGIQSLGYTGSGIYADTVDNGLVIRYNTVYGNYGTGIAIDADNSDFVYYNVSYNNLVWGISVFADANTSMTGHLIANNTLYNNFGAGLWVEGPSAGPAANGCTNNVFKNNIVFNTQAGPNLVAFNGCENPGTNGSGNVYTYNSLGIPSANFIEWGSGTYYSAYATWETATGNCGTTGCSNSLQTNPLFVNVLTPSLYLQATSPALAAGTYISGVNTMNPPNIGALGTTPITVRRNGIWGYPWQ